MIPYGKHSIDQRDIDAVVDVLQNRFLTQGESVPQFEQAICRYTGAQFCTAVNSGTSGLHVACLAAGVGAGDVVWTVPNSFVASANCALYCGATIDFVDIDPLTRNISPELLAQKLTSAARNNVLPKALIVVHFAGLSCDMQTIKELTQPYGITLIEDAAHALGGRYQSARIGSCEYSDMAVMSFHPVKSITTAEGGAVLTNNAELAERVVLFAKHGITRNADLMTEQHGPWYYQQLALGYNYRLSDLHAALGIAQLTRIDDFIQRRQQLAVNYHDQLSSLPMQLPIGASEVESKATQHCAWHLYMIEVLEHDRKDVYVELQKQGIGVNVHYIPIHLQPYYQRLGFTAGAYPNAERFYQRAITLPLFPDMTEEQQTQVVEALHKVLT